MINMLILKQELLPILFVPIIIELNNVPKKKKSQKEGFYHQYIPSARSKFT